MAYINELAWAQFNEALRVLKLSNHKDTLEHLRHLERTSETMLYALLKDKGSCNRMYSWLFSLLA